MIHMTGREPAYIRLYRELQQNIISGDYGYGTRIPSKRQMAEEKGVSLVTVGHAYELLEEEGYLSAKERSGYFVSYREGDIFTSQPQHMQYHASDRSDEEFPHTVFERAARKVLSSYGAQVLTRTEAKGNPMLRQAIASYLARSRNMHVSAEQIIIGAGTEYLYSLLVDLLGRSVIYGIEDPGYEKIRSIYKAQGVRTDALKLDSNGISTQELKRTPASVLHVTPYHSFPTGSTTDEGKRREYVAWAEERDAVIVEDDFESEFTPSIKAEETLQSLAEDRVIYMNTFTQTISSSIRVGYMVLPEKLMQQYEKTQAFRSCTVPEYIQLILAELIAGGSFERHLNRVRRKRRDQGNCHV